MRQPLGGVRVLVVDDHEDTRDAVAAALQREGAQVFTASSAQEALLRVESDRPDVLLADLEMPEVDGWALLRAVRSLPRERGGQTPAAALTIHNTPEDRGRSLRAGFRLHLATPCDPRELVDLVAALAQDSAKGGSRPPGHK